MLIILVMTSCGNDVVYECTPIPVFDTVVTMVFYNDGNYKNYYNDIKAKFNEINRIADDFEINIDKNNVYVLNPASRRRWELRILAPVL